MENHDIFDSSEDLQYYPYSQDHVHWWDSNEDPPVFHLKEEDLENYQWSWLLTDEE